MKLILDSTSLKHYPTVKPGFSGGTELMVKVLARGLADRGHTVHLVAADADTDEQWGPNLFVWGSSNHPTRADALLAVHDLQCASPDSQYHCPLLVYLPNGIGAFLGDNDAWAGFIDGVACFSQCHKDLMVTTHPTIPAEKMYVTGLGVDLNDYPPSSFHADGTPDWLAPKVPGRLFFSNDPARGLWHVLDIYERIVAAYPEASLHIGYDFERQFADRKWRSDWRSAMLWESAKRMQTLPNVVNLGALTRDETITAETACHVHVMPSDPGNVGSQIDGLLQRELMATGTPCVLSDIEAFPEVFSEAATILPLPGTYMDEHERRYDAQDWADVCLEIIRDPVKWQEMSRASRALAERQTWGHMLDRFDAMLHDLASKVNLNEQAA